MAANIANLQSHLYHGAHGLETDPLRNFKFLVKFNHKLKGKKAPIGLSLGFNSIEGLNFATESIPYRQGGYNTTVQQIPGQTSFSPISMSNGVMLGNRQKWDWMRELFAVQVGQGTGRRTGEARAFRSDMKIFVLEHPVTSGVAHQAPLIVNVFNAWPTSISYGALNAMDNGFLVEQVTFVHEGFSLDWDSSLKV